MEDEIVVGICTKNCAHTIKYVVKTVDKGLRKFYPDKKCLIIVSDGFSIDGTREIADAVKTKCDKLVMKQRGDIGKGNGVKTIFQEGVKKGAKVFVLVDGDLTSIKPLWVKLLAYPIVGGYDLTIPYYARNKYDGVITNQLAYPLTRALFWSNIRQPIGGDFGLSSRYVKRLLKKRKFPHQFGIDIFISLTAIVEGMREVEVELGVKEHESTKTYNEPRKILIPMYNQVIGTYFNLIKRYMCYIRNVKRIKNVERIPLGHRKKPSPIKINEKALVREFKHGFRKLTEKDLSIFPSDLREELVGVYKSKFDFPMDLWVRAVYYVIRAYHKGKDVLDTLRVLWRGRYASFVIETRDMSEKEAEAVIKEQAELFMNYKPLLYGQRL